MLKRIAPKHPHKGFSMATPPATSKIFDHFNRGSLFARYAVPLLVVGAWTLFIKLVYPQIELVNLKMTYLGLNVILAMRYGLGASILSSTVSVLAFIYFFIPPYFSIAFSDAKYWITLLVTVGIAALVSRLTLQSARSAQEAIAAETQAEREKTISSLLSSVSHDLRTPLTSISGAASTLLSEDAKISAENRRHLLETINEESVRLTRLVEKILQLTRIESGNVQIRKELRSLEEIIGSVLHRLDALLEGRQVIVQVPQDLTAALDDILIEQVLVNLLENAARHTPAGAPIEVHAFRDARKVWVEIFDRGPGIPDAEKERIFEKFYRGSRVDARGSGLGLAVCQGVLKMHQGLVGVKDREGGGSIFYFTLPILE